MPSFCAVSTCEQKYSHSENVSFHKFPLRNPKVLAKWIKFTNRGTNWKPSRWNSICSRHFDKSDFREYLSRKCLKKDAIPSIVAKNNISYETYHLSTGATTASPEDTRTVNSEQDEYSGQMLDEGKMEASEVIEACRLCGERADLTCNPLRSLDEPEIELMFRKCLPAVNLNGYLDQSHSCICTDCVSQLKQYSNFIDRVLSYQREFSAVEHFDSFTTNENSLVHENAAKFSIKPSTPNTNAALFIKQEQEPINVKQEKIDNSNRRSFSVQLPMTSPSLCPNPFADSKKIKGSIQNDVKPSSPPKQETQNNSTYCYACDRIFGNCFEFRSHKCTKAEQQCTTDREVGNNCEIMEVITINNPVSFIDLAEDENATTLESRPLKTENFTEQFRKDRLEFEHAYAKRTTNYSLKQEIIDSNIECGYECIEQTNENDLQPFYSNTNTNTEDDANQIYFECPSCNQSFISQELLDEHSTQMHSYPLKMKICPICNAEFKSSIEYLIHKNKMHAQRHQCRQCKRKFNTTTILRSHERLCTRESKDFCFLCRHCGKNIQNSAIMRKHLNNCAGKQTESVDEWQQQSKKSTQGNALRLKQFKKFNESCINNSINASDQMAISSDASILTEIRVPNLNDKGPDDCNAMQSFKFIVDDSKFIFLNESNSTIPCNQTNECGGFNGSLNGKFACDCCGRPFSTFIELKQHKRDVHDSERKFSCSLCPKTFKGISGLKQHISGYHYKIKPHLCPVCNYSYALKGDMQRCRHSKLRTPNNFKII